MNTKNLMIDDWVYIWGKKAQVAWVRNDGRLDLRGFPTPFCEDEIEPIPLTPDILEKNGFKVMEYTDDTGYFFHDGYRINVDFNEGLPADDIPPTIYLSIDFAEKDIAMPIEYVHELQQAMRIMGCDKEIKL